MRCCPYSLFLAWRLLTGRGRRGLLLICLLGVLLSVAGQVVVGGVMQGMIREVENGLRAYCPHLMLRSSVWTPEQLEALPEVRRASRGTAGMALVDGALCSYVASLPLAAWPEGERLALDDDCCVISATCAERLGEPRELVMRFGAGEADERRLRVVDVFHVPGRMKSPDVVCFGALPGPSVIGLELEPWGDADELAELITRRDASALLPALWDGNAGWLGVLAQLRASLSFLFAAGVLASAFCACALLMVGALQRRGSMAAYLAIGATPRALAAVYAWQALLLMAAAVPAGLLLGHGLLLGREGLARVFEFCGMGMYDAQALDMPLPAAMWPGLYAYAALTSCLALAFSVLPAALVALRSATPRALAGSAL